MQPFFKFSLLVILGTNKMFLKQGFLLLLCLKCIVCATSNFTYENVILNRVKRASMLTDVLFITSYPFVVFLTSPLPTQGMGVIIHQNWVLTRDAIVMNYKLTPRNVKIKSGNIDVLNAGQIHHATRIETHPSAQQAPNYINLQALVRVCPAFATGSVVTLPPASQVWSSGTIVTVLRWQNTLTQLKEQTATLQSGTCYGQPTLLVCTENIPLLTNDLGVPIVSSPGKVLVGIGTRRSLATGTTKEGFEVTAKYLTWINPIIAT